MKQTKKPKEPPITCLQCYHANTTSYGFPVCYEVGTMLGGKLVAKSISLTNKACVKFKPKTEVCR
jgi:hypothetical protein